MWPHLNSTGMENTTWTSSLLMTQTVTSLLTSWLISTRALWRIIQVTSWRFLFLHLIQHLESNTHKVVIMYTPTLSHEGWWSGCAVNIWDTLPSLICSLPKRPGEFIVCYCQRLFAPTNICFILLKLSRTSQSFLFSETHFGLSKQIIKSTSSAVEHVLNGTEKIKERYLKEKKSLRRLIFKH